MFTPRPMISQLIVVHTVVTVAPQSANTATDLPRSNPLGKLKLLLGVTRSQPGDVVRYRGVRRKRRLITGVFADLGDVEPRHDAASCRIVALFDLELGVWDHLVDGVYEITGSRLEARRNVVDAVVQLLGCLDKRDTPATVGHVTHVAAVSRIRGAAREVRIGTVHCGVYEARGQVRHRVVERSVDAGDAKRHRLDPRSVSDMGREDLI